MRLDPGAVLRPVVWTPASVWSHCCLDPRLRREFVARPPPYREVDFDCVCVCVACVRAKLRGRKILPLLPAAFRRKFMRRDPRFRYGPLFVSFAVQFIERSIDTSIDKIN